jgi:hypothetical protein
VVEIVAVLLFIASVADEKTKRYVTGSLCDFGYMASRASGFHLRHGKCKGKHILGGRTTPDI